jgi:hypothetical protein
LPNLDGDIDLLDGFFSNARCVFYCDTTDTKLPKVSHQSANDLP